MKQQISSKKVCIILFIMITLQVLFITNGYIHKKDYHSDEVWSFGLANSFYKPYIYMTEDETETTNIAEWLSGDVIRDYVSVNDEDKFSYGSVIYNMGEDQHPPLYFMIIHTISSILPGTYSLWYGYVLNVIFFIIGQIYIYRLTKDITESKLMGICACLLWGFSVGAMSITIFIRHYAISVMFIIMSCYYHNRLLKYQEFDNGNLIKLSLITLLGCMSNHYFTICQFVIDAYVCVCILIMKKYKVLIKYMISQIGMVAIYVGLIFPEVFNQIFMRSAYSTSMKKANYDYQVFCCINYMMNELFGIVTPIYGTMFWVYFDVLIMILALIAVPVVIIFRNETWLHNIIKGLMYSIRKWVYVLRDKIKKIPLIIPMMYITGIINIFIVAYMVSVPLMSDFTDRYLFLAYPLIQIAILTTLYLFIKLLVRRKHLARVAYVLIAVSALLCIWSNWFIKSPYLFTSTVIDDEYLSNKQVDDIIKGSDCLIGYSEIWCLTMAPEYAYDVNNFYAFPLESYDMLSVYAKDYNTQKDVYLLCDIDGTKLATEMFGAKIEYPEDVNVDGIDREDFFRVIGDLPYTDKAVYMGYTYSFGRKLELYKVK